MANRTLTATQKRWLSKARRETRAGWLHLHIEGGPRERGFQHGYLLAADLHEGLRVNKYLATWDTGDSWEFFVEWAQKLYLDIGRRHFPEILDEIEGIAEGSRAAGYDLRFEDVLAWNAYIEMMFSWWPLHQKARPPRPFHHHGHHCSAFIATGSATTDGRIVMAHNTWDVYANADCFNLLLDIQPSSGHRMFMQSIPGYTFSGLDWFITDAGLMGTETTIGGFSGYDEKKFPEFYRARTAMQYADSLDDWCRIMSEQNNGGYANSWLVGQRATGEILRLETGLRFIGRQQKTDGWYWGCNIADDLRIRNQECSDAGYSDVSSSGARRVRWMQLFEPAVGTKQSKVDVRRAKQWIADHFDVFAGKADAPSSRTLCGHLELDPGGTPYYPWGANDGKVMDSELAANWSFWARWGHACGLPFDAEAFLAQRPQYRWLEGYLKSRPRQPWTRFRGGDMKG
jgi:hypothetical protein